MDTLEYETIVSAFDEYIGDDLTWEDLKRGLSVFLEDEEYNDVESVGDAQ